MFIGQARTGKTSLKKSLKGEAFNQSEESTDGIETDPSYFKVSTEIWKTGEKNQETDSEASISFENHAAAQLICESLMAGKLKSQDLADSSTSSSGLSVADHNLGGFSEEQELRRIWRRFVEDQFSTIDTEEEDAHPSAPKLPEAIAALVEKRLRNGKSVEEVDEVYSVLWDFGGQSVYYDTHPIFLTEKAIYILVCDLSQDPDKKANPPEKIGLYENNIDICCGKTNLEYLDIWMSSVYSLANPNVTCREPPMDVPGTSPRRLPPVFLVCTHADMPYCSSNARDLGLKIYGFLRKKIYREHLFKDVFVVDNTKSGSEQECPEVRRLREEVLAVANELPQMNEAIPLKWLEFEKALQIRKESDKWIPLDQAKQIASNDCSIDDDEEFSTLLNLLHDQRIVIHFSGSPELEKMVILDPQWLIDVCKKIITVKRYDHSEEKVEVMWLKLEETGILDEKLIDHVWKPLFGNQETHKSLIAIMERLSLICSWPSSNSSKQYLVPSMLMSPPTDEVLEIIDSVQVPSLFVKFELGRVPHGLFSRLLLQFFQWCDKEWKSQVNPKFFKNFAMFHIRPDEGSSVAFLCHSSSIEIIFLSGNDDLDTSRTIHWQLTLILECMRNEFFWLANMRYEMCVCCPVCSQSVKCRKHGVRGCEECLHFLSQSDLRELKYCNRAGIRRDCRIHVEPFVPWFSFSDEQKVRISINQNQAANGRDFDVNQTDERRKVSMEGAEGRTLALPDGVMKSIPSQACDSKDIVSQFQESLQLDSVALANPEPETKCCLTSQARSEKRTDILEYSREITPASTTGQTLALPDGVMTSIQSEVCDPKDIVSRFQESLQLSPASLANPEPETKRWIRCLAIQAKSKNRSDVVKYLREITPAGTTGPLLNENLDVRRIPFPQRKDLTFSLSGGDEWKLLAERLGLSHIDIRFFEKRVLNPCDVVLGAVGNHRHLSVGEVYDMLVGCELPAFADIM
ncbi:uncharacterized protein LOC144661691 isoform X1 [Oculina patagonica]